MFLYGCWMMLDLPVPGVLAAPPASGALPYSGPFSSSGSPNALNDILKSLPPAFAAFIANLPPVEGIFSFYQIFQLLAPVKSLSNVKIYRSLWFVVSFCFFSQITPLHLHVNGGLPIEEGETPFLERL